MDYKTSLISVIIPIYNVENYLNKCLDSIIKQTYKNIEIICINDGSTDSSLEILQNYAKKDVRIKIINQVNKGLGTARNVGLSIANGEFISFVDSDDWVDEDLYKTCIDNIKDDIDIVAFGAKTVNLKNNKIYKGQYSSKNFKKGFNLLNLFNIHTVAWNKLYRHSFLLSNNIIFDTPKTGEDQFFFIKTVLNTQNIFILKKDLYFYCKYRKGALSNNKDYADLSTINNTYNIVNYLKDKRISERIKNKIIAHYLLKVLSWDSKIEKTKRSEVFGEIEKLFEHIKNNTGKFWWDYFNIEICNTTSSHLYYYQKFQYLKSYIMYFLCEKLIMLPAVLVFSIDSIPNIFSKDNEHIYIKFLNFRMKIRKNRLSNRRIIELNSSYEKADNSCLVKLPKIKNTKETLQTLLDTNMSICRYGDGEFNLIFGNDLSFQKYSSNLAVRLKEILSTNNPNIMVAIPDRFATLDMCSKKEANYWRRYFAYNREKVYSLLNFGKLYYDALVSRPYIGIQDKSNCKDYFNQIKQIWQYKQVVFVEGEATRLGYNNDLFANTKSIKRIICPARNAYEKYDEILSVCKSFSKDNLFILALGPTATVLAYDLSCLGYRALDVGHIDIEYEWFLMGATKKVAIKNKYVNEVKQGKKYSTLNDEIYKEEIVANLVKL